MSVSERLRWQVPNPLVRFQFACADGSDGDGLGTDVYVLDCPPRWRGAGFAGGDLWRAVSPDSLILADGVELSEARAVCERDVIKFFESER